MDEVWASSSMESLRMVDMLGKVDSPLFRVICTLKLQYYSSIQFPSQVQDFWTQLAWWNRTSIETAEITIAVSMFPEAGSTLNNVLLRPWQGFGIVLTPASILHFSIDGAHNSIAMSLFTYHGSHWIILWCLRRNQGVVKPNVFILLNWSDIDSIETVSMLLEAGLRVEVCNFKLCSGAFTGTNELLTVAFSYSWIEVAYYSIETISTISEAGFHVEVYTFNNALVPSQGLRSC